MKRLVTILTLTVPLSLAPFPGLSAQKRALTFDDFIAMKAVGDPQLSPNGKWVAYTLTEYSLKDNRGTGRIWLAELGTGQTRRLTEGPGSDRQPRWSPDGTTLAFVSTRQNGPQLWVLSIAGGEARRVTNLADGVSDPLWLPDGKGLIVTSDIKWPADQEIDRRNGDYPTDARLWAGLLWRHWDDWRAGKRQHLFLVTLADNGGGAKDITPVDHDVPTIATGGDGDVAVAPDGREIAFAMHGDSSVADNTNVDVYLANPDGSGARAFTTGRGADNTPRYSPDGRWLAYLSLERPGFEADRVRLMLVGRKDGRTEGGNVVEATGGWTLSVGSYIWCPDSKCVYAVVEERGRARRFGVRLDPQATGVRPRPALPCRLPDSWRAPRRLGRQLARALELPDVRRTRLLGRRRQLSWLDGLRAEVHRRDLPTLGRLPVRRRHDGPRRGGAAPLRRFDPHGRGRSVVRRLHDLLDRGSYRPLQGAGRSRRRVQSGEYGRHDRGAVVRGLGVRRHALRQPGRVREVVAAQLRAALEDPDADRPLPARLPSGSVGGLPGVHGAQGERRAGEILVLPGRGPLGAQAPQPPPVVEHGARLGRPILEAGRDGHRSALARASCRRLYDFVNTLFSRRTSGKFCPGSTSTLTTSAANFRSYR